MQAVFTERALVRYRWPIVPELRWLFHNPEAGHEASRYTLIRKDDGIQVETYILRDF